ncbi:MAG: replicative DNA helicase [Thiotrichales bacterium]|nr:replicative DNA helicase [Thiotrichales bacterium]
MADPLLDDVPSKSGDRAIRVPPHSVEAEQAVLGGVLIDNDAWDRIAGIVTSANFYRNDHRAVFEAVSDLCEEGRPCDAVTVAERLDRSGQLESAGELAYLAELAENTPSAANIVAYAEIVRERAVLRELIRISTEIAESAFRPQGRGALELLDDAERRVFEIADRGNAGRRESVAIKDVLSNVMERIDDLSRQESTIIGVPTGFDDLDQMTAGLQRGDLVIVAGRPSMGKTAFAMNIVEEAAIRGKLSVIVFSMEMPAEQLTMRMLSSLGRIDQQKVRTGRLGHDDWPRLTSQVALLNDTNIFIVDDSALTPTELHSRCRRLKREHGIDLVVIDYLQLMYVPGTRENRATEISEISRSLKALAKELMVPVVACSQLNRRLEDRQNKRPVMSDLRESGAIEQDADLILFIYRDEVYDEESKDKGKAEIIVGKQRNGPIGKVDLAFLGRYARFEDYTAVDYTGDYPG